jgi:SAM-dependent methyltransferase
MTPGKLSVSGFQGFTGSLDETLAVYRYWVAKGLMSDVDRRGRILDIGCGRYPLFLRGSGFAQRYGLDRLIDMDSLNQYRAEGMSLLKLDINSSGGMLPFIGECFDAVTMLAFFEHVNLKDIRPLLKEVHRTLKPEGVLVLTTPPPWSEMLLGAMANTGMITQNSLDEHQDYYTRGRISAMLRGVGFQENLISTGYFDLCMNIWAKAIK